MLKKKIFNPRLGVNIDHIATLREVRGEIYPDPFSSLKILKSARASQVTLHLREDRRHIQDADVTRIIASKILPVNLEIAVVAEMLQFAILHKPKLVTLVPERRAELTTEGGLNCLRHKTKRRALAKNIAKLKKSGLLVSVFIDPHVRQVQAAHDFGVDAIEIHTGGYCQAVERYFLQKGNYQKASGFLKDAAVQQALRDVQTACEFANVLGLRVFAGHGLNVFNLSPVVKLGLIEEYNIGHSIISRAVFVGLKVAVLEIQTLLRA